MQKEALFYEKTENGFICKLCPHHCLLDPEKTGICQTRKVYVNKVYSISYGNLTAINNDPIEKKPLYHYLPGTNTLSIGTAGCILKCKQCQNSNISVYSPTQVNSIEIPPNKLIAKAQELELHSISYTYNDPVAYYEYVLDSAEIAQQAGIKNILVSSGYINKEPLRALLPYLDAANIDLKAFDDGIYKKLCKGTLAPVLDTLLMLKGAGVWLEITNLIIPDWTNSMPLIEKMCKWLAENGFHNTPLHFTRFTPMHYLPDLPETEIADLLKAKQIAEQNGIQFVYLGNIRNAEANSTYCPECKKKLIERQGYFVVKNAISAGSCPYCKAEIAGYFEPEV